MVLSLAVYVSVAWGNNDNVALFFPVRMIENEVYNVAMKDLLPVIYTPVLLSFLCIPRDNQSS